MHRFNALTFTYVRVVCAQLPPRLHSPTPPTPPTALSHASSPPPRPGHLLCSLALAFAAVRAYKLCLFTFTSLWHAQADEPGSTQLATGNWELGTGKLSHGHGVLLGLGLGLRLGLVVVLVLRTGVSPGINVSVINASTALWHFGFLGGWRGADVIPAASGLRLRLLLQPRLHLHLHLQVGLDSTWVWVRVRVRCAFYVNLLTTILAFVCALLCVAGWIPLDLGSRTEREIINFVWHMLIIGEHLEKFVNSVENLPNWV